MCSIHTPRNSADSGNDGSYHGAGSVLGAVNVRGLPVIGSFSRTIGGGVPVTMRKSSSPALKMYAHTCMPLNSMPLNTKYGRQLGIVVLSPAMVVSSVVHQVVLPP